MTKPHVTRNSGNAEWYTPPAFIEAARRVMGSIDCDPASCAIANTVVKAATYYTIENSGLDNPWHGNIWMNPPYGRGVIDAFALKFKYRWEFREFDQGIVLVNNATETQWFANLAEGASAICHIKGRIRFLTAKLTPAKTPIQGQAVLYFGPHVDRFEAEFSDFGKVWIARKRAV